MVSPYRDGQIPLAFLGRSRLIGPPQQQGLTLTEILVVVFLVGVLAAIAAPSYLAWATKQRVEDALVVTVGALKEAQAEAIRKSQGCEVQITPATQTIRATTFPAASPAVNCLPTGNRVLSSSAADLQLTTSFTPEAPLRFTYRGTTPRQGILVLAHPGTPRQRCVVVSAGIGIIRTGYYRGDPASPSLANCHRDP
ncbi:GspH/FimT family pseudopilin [Lyngbya confervoides]|uniref:GspH/FimT family pseudopilin n=1 Tax=Lyngbya confervoides BDU141951 TaxID=1574623 RepID=A0ABD4T3L7_9CYAN|nr:GspH/FimT family pseudopilin [Lyngbya confervoides]MCM1983078.1 GspH/FimT family pseudopilin [Lyngbya confervoides BDU141951]